MFKILRSHESRVLAITRILLGVMFTCHGTQKLLGAFGGTADMKDSWSGPKVAALGRAGGSKQGRPSR